MFSATQKYPDSGASQGKLGVKINNAQVSTQDSNKGILCSSTAATWVDSSPVAINTSNYDINWGEALEINCTQAGSTHDGEALSVTLVFVYD
jgi:hypothetical protein